MSSTRRAVDGEFHQESFCSSPEFDSGAINGLAASKRISIVKDKAVREVLWFIQWRSLAAGGLQQLCDEVLATFPDRIGTPTLRKVFAKKRRFPSEKELKAIRSESHAVRPGDISAIFGYPEFLSADWTEVCRSPG